MSTPTAAGVPPTGQDRDLARASGPRFASLARSGRPVTLRVRTAGAEETIRLPAGAVKLLAGILEDMGAGRAVTLLPSAAELTTQQAADFLSVSRPFLVRLLEEKRIPFRKVGRHRRVLLEDVARYKQAIDAARRGVLDALAAEAQELDPDY